MSVIRSQCTKKDGTPLFSMVLSPFDVRTEGWSGKDESSTYAFASVTLLDGSGKDQGKWRFSTDL